MNKPVIKTIGKEAPASTLTVKQKAILKKELAQCKKDLIKFRKSVNNDPTLKKIMLFGKNWINERLGEKKIELLKFYEEENSSIRYYGIICLVQHTSVRLSSDEEVTSICTKEVFDNSSKTKEELEKIAQSFTKREKVKHVVIRLNKEAFEEFGDLKEPLWTYPDVHLTNFYRLIELNKKIFKKVIHGRAKLERHELK